MRIGPASAAALVSTLAAHPVSAQQADPPTLVVFLTIDQMRGDYLDRYGAQLTGGLARLARGAVFAQGYQDQANAETSPGHASTLSGRFPSHTGIFSNELGVGDPQAPLIGGGGPGASPFRFQGSTLIDWLRARDPRSRALSVSRKDRGAILPLGGAHQAVYWYASDGRVTTSTYYADTLPTWVQRFSARNVPRRMAGEVWTPLLPDSAYPEDDRPAVEPGVGFEHALPSDSARAAAVFPAVPWMDQLTLDFALAGMQQMRLGAGPATDLLAISLSTTDAVGHAYGPDSRELHDQILRVDRMLGVFLDSLFRLRDSSRVIIALTADHGITPFVELSQRRGHPEAQHVVLDSLAGAFEGALARRGIDTTAFRFENAALFVERGAFRLAGVNPDSVARAFVAAARRVSGVARADLVSDLARQDTLRDPIARRWVHAIPPYLDVAAVLTPAPYSVWGAATSAQHGTPNDLDTHVPIIFYGPPFRPGRYTGFARVVDMAPTLAQVLGVVPTDLLDGRVLREALR